jgi:hypothetical protein
MPAPFGWVIDIRGGKDWLACSYPQGLSIEKAVAANEWMYVRISPKREPANNLDECWRYTSRE